MELRQRDVDEQLVCLTPFFTDATWPLSVPWSTILLNIRSSPAYPLAPAWLLLISVLCSRQRLGPPQATPAQ